jgi:hypothetical protein
MRVRYNRVRLYTQQNLIHKIFGIHECIKSELNCLKTVWKFLFKGRIMGEIMAFFDLWRNYDIYKICVDSSPLLISWKQECQPIFYDCWWQRTGNILKFADFNLPKHHRLIYKIEYYYRNQFCSTALWFLETAKKWRL